VAAIKAKKPPAGESAAVSSRPQPSPYLRIVGAGRPGPAKTIWKLLEPEWKGERLMTTAAIQNVRDVLAAYPGLADIAVLAREHESVGQVLVAYIVPGSPGLNMTALHTHVREHMPGSAVPAAIVVVDAIPVNSAGTADPQALPAPDLRGVAPYRSPITPRQEILCTIFAEVLARTRCGVDDNFFTLGGESIDAMLIASRVGPAIGQEITMNELFDAPTVAELDLLLDRLSGVGG